MSGTDGPQAGGSPTPEATRFDGPHHITGADSGQVPAEPELPITDLAAAQASELAGHLRAQQRDLDRREAQLNARTAQLDKDLRASRIWLQERECQSAQREAELEQQVRQLREQVAAIAAAEVSGEIDASAADSQDAEADRRVIVEPLELDSPEALLRQTLSQIEAQRAELARERQQHEQRVTHARETLEARYKRLRAESTQEREKLRQRSAALDQRSAALDQLHAEVATLHQAALESRLIVQQVWVQLAERFEVARLAQAVSQARQRLDDQYRLQRNKQRQQREELTQLARRLDKRRQQLASQQAQLRIWTVRRNEELEEQAARLVAREQELDRQHRQFEQLREAWREEKHAYQRQICELAGRLSRIRPAA